MTAEAEAPTRSGFIALIGAPNTGKSTLINALVGAKVSIVTPKVQTTRCRIVGVAMQGTSQLVLVDTPGIFPPKRRLDRAMVAAAWNEVAGADLILALIDAKSGMTEATEAVLDRAAEAGAGKPIYLALNKIDLVPRDMLLPLAAAAAERVQASDIFMISALTGDGLDRVRETLAAAIPESPYLYPEDQIADMPLRLLAAEITREQLFLKLHQELPYALAVETESWEEREDGSIAVEQVIYVTRDSHKPIVLGKGGQMIKRIGTEARVALEKITDQRVHLSLFVKVKPDWQDRPDHYRLWGLEAGA